MGSGGRRPLLISNGWVQLVVLVVLCGFFVMGPLAYRSYQAKPPLAQRTVDENGRVLYTARDVSEGQQVFLHNGLMAAVPFPPSTTSSTSSSALTCSAML